MTRPPRRRTAPGGRPPFTSTNARAGRVLRARAPLRLSFAGGGTDVPPFPALEGGIVLNATICRYAYGTLVPRDDADITIESLDFGAAITYAHSEPLAFDGQLDLVKAAIRSAAPSGRSGFDLVLRTSAPPGSGLGASSAMTVALVGLLNELDGVSMSAYEIADRAYLVERTEFGINGGLQDHYAATFGGFSLIEFDADRVVVNPVPVGADTINELEHNLLLCYTGLTRPSDRIIDDQVARLERRDPDVLGSLRRQKELAIEMRAALVAGRLGSFAEWLHEAWELKRRLSPRISTPFVEEVYEEACRNGALGGKVTGAGGGGHVLFYCDYRRIHRVAEALARMGTSVTDVAFEPRGLQTWSVRAG